MAHPVRLLLPVLFRPCPCRWRKISVLTRPGLTQWVTMVDLESCNRRPSSFVIKQFASFELAYCVYHHCFFCGCDCTGVCMMWCRMSCREPRRWASLPTVMMRPCSAMNGRMRLVSRKVPMWLMAKWRSIPVHGAAVVVVVVVVGETAMTPALFTSRSILLLFFCCSANVRMLSKSSRSRYSHTAVACVVVVVVAPVAAAAARSMISLRAISQASSRLHAKTTL